MIGLDLYKDYEDLKERYQIMAENGSMTNQQIFDYLKPRTTVDNIVKLRAYVIDLINQHKRNAG